MILNFIFLKKKKNNELDANNLKFIGLGLG